MWLNCGLSTCSRIVSEVGSARSGSLETRSSETVLVQSNPAGAPARVLDRREGESVSEPPVVSQA